MHLFSGKRETKKEHNLTAAAIILSVISLAFAVGVARWSWLIIDEQIKLRREFVELKNAQEQLNIQFDFWNSRLQK